MAHLCSLRRPVFEPRNVVIPLGGVGSRFQTEGRSVHMLSSNLARGSYRACLEDVLICPSPALCLPTYLPTNLYVCESSSVSLPYMCSCMCRYVICTPLQDIFPLAYLPTDLPTVLPALPTYPPLPAHLPTCQYICLSVHRPVYNGFFTYTVFRCTPRFLDWTYIPNAYALCCFPTIPCPNARHKSIIRQ